MTESNAQKLRKIKWQKVTNMNLAKLSDSRQRTETSRNEVTEGDEQTPR